MDAVKRKKELGYLILQARTIKALSYNNPRKDLWREYVKVFLKNTYGVKYEKMFNDALWWGDGPFQTEQYPQLHGQAMTRAIKYLTALKKEKPALRSHKLSKKQGEVVEASSRYYKHIIISNVTGGNFVFKGNATFAQITVHDVVIQLRKEIETKVPDAPEKRSVLESLQQITENETFANITGVLLGQLLK